MHTLAIKLSKYKINVNLIEGVSILLLLHDLLKKTNCKYIFIVETH